MTISSSIFDGASLTAYTLPSIKGTLGTVLASDSGYRDALCSQIGAEVQKVVLTAEGVSLSFVGSVAFVISLQEADYVGPEAINFMGKNGILLAIRS